MTAADLMGRLAVLRCTVVVKDGKPSVQRPKLWGNAEAAELADLLPLLRLHREAILARFTPAEVEPWTCDVCAKIICVTPDEWRSVAGSPLFCDRAGASEARGIGGRVVPAVPRCPFKPGDRV